MMKQLIILEDKVNTEKESSNGVLFDGFYIAC